MSLPAVARWIGLATILFAGQATAQAPGEVSAETVRKFSEFRKSDFYIRLLVARALEDDRKMPPPCTDFRPYRRELVSVMRPIKFDGEAKEPTSGVWLERLHVRRCGKIVYRNVFFVAKPNDILKAGDAAPSLTKTDLRLQIDAGRGIMIADRVRDPSCRERTLVDTEVLSQPPAGGGPWLERWTVHACGVTASHDVTFTPNARGGVTYSVNATRK